VSAHNFTFVQGHVNSDELFDGAVGFEVFRPRSWMVNHHGPHAHFLSTLVYLRAESKCSLFVSVNERINKNKKIRTSRFEEVPAVKNTMTLPRKASVRRSSFDRDGRSAAVSNEPAIMPKAAPAIGDTLGIVRAVMWHC
jgi:hypothetical protein